MPTADEAKALLRAKLAELETEAAALVDADRELLAEYAADAQNVLADLSANIVTPAEAEQAAAQLYNATKSRLLLTAIDARKAGAAAALGVAQGVLGLLIKLAVA